MKDQLSAKQLVRFPYCRIYRRFLNSIVENPAIRKQGQALLFRYAALFRWPTSARRCALWMASAMRCRLANGWQHTASCANGSTCTPTNKPAHFFTSWKP